MTNQLTHVADVKVGKVKGKSRTYPQLRLLSEYNELVGKKASIYETSEHQGETTFVIRLNDENRVAAYNERAERAEASFACAKPCRGSDSGSNPDSGASLVGLCVSPLAFCVAYVWKPRCIIRLCVHA
jgi:hypothetical protein